MRLLRSTKDKVASRVAQEKYSAVLKDAQDKLWEYASSLVIGKIGDKFLQEIITDANHHHLNRAYSVTFFTKYEKTSWCKDCKTIAIPAEIFIPYLNNIEITESQMNILMNHFREVQDVKSLQNSLQTRLKRTMDNLRTYNRVTELLPELKPYIDEEIKKSGDEVPITKKLAKGSIDRAIIQNLRKELKQ